MVETHNKVPPQHRRVLYRLWCPISSSLAEKRKRITDRGDFASRRPLTEVFAEDTMAKSSTQKEKWGRGDGGKQTVLWRRGSVIFDQAPFDSLCVCLFFLFLFETKMCVASLPSEPKIKYSGSRHLP